MCAIDLALSILAVLSLLSVSMSCVERSCARWVTRSCAANFAAAIAASSFRDVEVGGGVGLVEGNGDGSLALGFLAFAGFFCGAV